MTTNLDMARAQLEQVKAELEAAIAQAGGNELPAEKVKK